MASCNEQAGCGRTCARQEVQGTHRHNCGRDACRRCGNTVKRHAATTGAKAGAQDHRKHEATRVEIEAAKAARRTPIALCGAVLSRSEGVTLTYNPCARCQELSQ